MANLYGYESFLTDIDFENLVEEHYNEYCSACNLEDEWYFMEDLDNQLTNKTPREILNSVVPSAFDLNDKYFYYDGYANIRSFYNFSEYIEKVVDESQFLKWCDEMEYLDEYKPEEEDEEEDEDE